MVVPSRNGVRVSDLLLIKIVWECGLLGMGTREVMYIPILPAPKNKPMLGYNKTSKEPSMWLIQWSKFLLTRISSMLLLILFLIWAAVLFKVLHFSSSSIRETTKVHRMNSPSGTTL